MGISLIVLMSKGAVLHAGPAAPIIQNLSQSDGTIFQAKILGDEWSNQIQTVEGFTIDRGADGNWKYVIDYRGIDPVLSNIMASETPPTALKRGVMPRDNISYAQRYQNGKVRSSSRSINFDGSVLLILVQFSDRKGTYDATSFASFVSGGIKKYFETASMGKASLSIATESHGVNNDGVIGWLDMETNHPNTGDDSGDRNQQLAADAILAADPYINYASYDKNGDNIVSSDELAVVVVVAGYETSYGTTAPSVWAHQWVCKQPAEVDGVTLGKYAQIGEIHGNDKGDHQATLGIIVHELGHLIYKLPDFYDRDYSSAGIGNWGLMSGGSWGRSASDSFVGQTPVLLSAFARYSLGWATSGNGPGKFEVTAAGAKTANAENTVVKLSSKKEGEFFLVENRQPVGYDKGLEGTLGKNFKGGLAIWHIDESKENNDTECVLPADCSTDHFLTALVQADDLWELEKKKNQGNVTDLYSVATEKVSFSSSSVPNSKLYNGDDSGVEITGISGNNLVMSLTYRLGGEAKAQEQPAKDVQPVKTEDTEKQVWETVLSF